MLFSEIYRDGNIKVEYTANPNQGWDPGDVGPFSSSFSNTYTNVFEDQNDLFSDSINTTHIITWETETSNDTFEIPTDARETHRTLTLKWESTTIIVEYTINLQPTVKNNNDIIIEINFIHDYIINLVNKESKGSDNRILPLTPFSTLMFSITIFLIMAYFRKSIID